MTDPVEVDRRTRELLEAVGRCLMNWSGVELRLVSLWNLFATSNVVASDQIWNGTRSFDAKMMMFKKVAERLLPPEFNADWNLIHMHVSGLYAKRNQVAHSTMKHLEGTEPVIEPFYAITALSRRNLTASDVNAYSQEFAEASLLLMQMTFAVRPLPPHLQSQVPTHDLLLRLREKDALMREAQRHRSLAWRQYLDRNPGLKPH